MQAAFHTQWKDFRDESGERLSAINAFCNNFKPPSYFFHLKQYYRRIFSFTFTTTTNVGTSSLDTPSQFRNCFLFPATIFCLNSVGQRLELNNWRTSHGTIMTLCT